jgi:hypothetical protein
MSKRCACCAIEKPALQFTKDAQKSDGLSSYCQACLRTKQKERYLQKHGRTNKDRQSLSVTNYAAYKKTWSEENQERVCQYYKKYRETHTDAVRARNMGRYASKRQRSPAWLTKAHVAEIEGMYLFCQLFFGFQVDHIVPLLGKEVSGLHVPWNLQVLPAKQNRVKSNAFNPRIYPQQGLCAFMES